MPQTEKIARKLLSSLYAYICRENLISFQDDPMTSQFYNSENGKHTVYRK